LVNYGDFFKNINNNQIFFAYLGDAWKIHPAKLL
jgi:hypothetical protein